jgi:DNA-binding transcriptional MerR regulator
MAELSARSNIPIPTIKYYLREGLLPAGQRTAPNQATYEYAHLERLRLIRALVEVGGLPIEAVAAVLTAIDNDGRSLHEAMGVVQRRLGPVVGLRSGPGDRQVDEIVEYLDAHAWRISRAAPALAVLARVLDTLRELAWDVGPEAFDPYVAAVDDLAAWEVEQSLTHVNSDRVIEHMVVGTILFDTALRALRFLAHEHHSALRAERLQTSTRIASGATGDGHNRQDGAG